MHFITNGYKHFSKNNSTDPRQQISLTIVTVLQRIHFAAVNNFYEKSPRSTKSKSSSLGPFCTFCQVVVYKQEGHFFSELKSCLNYKNLLCGSRMQSKTSSKKNTIFLESRYTHGVTTNQIYTYTSACNVSNP